METAPVCFLLWLDNGTIFYISVETNTPYQQIQSTSMVLLRDCAPYLSTRLRRTKAGIGPTVRRSIHQQAVYCTRKPVDLHCSHHREIHTDAQFKQQEREEAREGRSQEQHCGVRYLKYRKLWTLGRPLYQIVRMVL